MKSLFGLTVFCALLTLSGPARSAPCAGFTDVDDAEYGSGLGSFCGAVEWMKNRGITQGCVSGGALYCPNEPVTRVQMAMFMQRLGNAITPRRFFVDQNPGPINIQMSDQNFVCDTGPIGFGNVNPRTAVAHGLVFGLVDAPVTWSADIWYTYDGAPQWYFMSNFIPLVAANAAGGTQAATFGYASVDARELSYQFAIRVRESPDAPAGSGNFADLGCHLMVELGNQQGSIQPYDSAVAGAAMPGGNLQRNR